MIKRLFLLLPLFALTALSPAQRVAVTDPLSGFESLAYQHGPTAWQDGGDNSRITSSSSAVSAWASKVGAVSFAQGVGANQPVTTRRDNRENRIPSSENLRTTAGWASGRTAELTDTEIKEDGTAGNTHYRSISFAAVSGSAYAFSAKIKRGTVGTRDACARVAWAGGNYCVLCVDLDDGSLDDTGCSGGGLAWSGAASILEGGYYKIGGTLVSNGTAGSVLIYLAQGTTIVYDGDNASSIIATEVQARSVFADSAYLTTAFAQYRGINGRQAIRFDGVDDSLASDAALSSLITAANGSFIWVGRLASLASAQQIFSDSNAAIRFGHNATNAYFYNDDGSADSRQASGTVANTATVWFGRHDGGALYLDVNGARDATGAASGDSYSLTGTTNLGTNFGSVYQRGDTAEFLTFNKPLGLDVRSRLQRGLCKKFAANCL